MKPNAMFEAWFEAHEGYEYMEGDPYSDEKRWAFEAGAEQGANDALKKLKKKLDEAALRKHQHALEHQGPGAYGHVRGLRHAQELINDTLREAP